MSNVRGILASDSIDELITSGRCGNESRLIHTDDFPVPVAPITLY